MPANGFDVQVEISPLTGTAKPVPFNLFPAPRAGLSNRWVEPKPPPPPYKKGALVGACFVWRRGCLPWMGSIPSHQASRSPTFIGVSAFSLV